MRYRKTMTHRNGKPLYTMEMARETKEHTNPLEQLIIIIKNVFPWLIDDLANLTDTRNESYIEYDMEEVTLIRLLALCCGIQSMTEIATKLNRKEFIKNVNSILNLKLKKFPCDDTISNVINIINVKELESIRTKMIKKLIEAKTLDKYRLFNGSFFIVFDGSGLYSTTKDLGKGAIYKVHNKNTDKEYTTYEYYVLEAKLICDDFVFSFATEFVENEHMNNETEKQDCELKAAHRLLDKIREEFPKLPITIGGDALYVNKPFMDACIAHKMDYILRYKDTVMSTIEEEFNQIKREIKDSYEYVNDLVYGSGTKKSDGKTNIITLKEENKDNNFTFVTSLTITADNYKDIYNFGRKRWKIENQGFKDQKSRVLNVEHCYTYDNNGTKAHYFFIQIAHMLITILYYGSAIMKKLKETKVEVANLLYIALIHYNEINITQGFQIRFG